MKKTRIFALAAVLTAGMASTAFAAYDNIGSISVDYNRDRDSASPDFGGPVEKLQFTARGSDVQCSYIRVVFRNGQTKQLFNGRLAQNQPRNVDLPGTSRDVARVNTNCRAFQRSGAKIDIAADIGNYRDTWRRSPNWSRTWAKMFNWTNTASTAVDQAFNYWVPITTLHFSGATDHDGTAAGWAARSVTAIGIKPLNADARCDRIVVVFGNGQKRDLGSRARLARGQTERFDLPGQERSIARLNMSCRPLGASTVNIQVEGKK